MELWLATGNKGKVSELTSLLSDLPIEIHSQSELSFFSQPPEDGDSFEANARIKAKALHALKSEAWVLSDDSGLVVEGLGGLPGIHSARYAGPKAQPSENNAKLLKMMDLRSAGNRKALFQCSLIAYSPDRTEHHFQGVLQGTIAKKLAGDQGFGYDPLFIPDGFDKTLAELGPGEKNQISHRWQALKEFKQLLSENL